MAKYYYGTIAYEVSKDDDDSEDYVLVQPQGGPGELLGTLPLQFLHRPCLFIELYNTYSRLRCRTDQLYSRVESV